MAQPTPTDIAAGRTVGALLGTVTNLSGVFSFIPTPTGLLVQETGKVVEGYVAMSHLDYARIRDGVT